MDTIYDWQYFLARHFFSFGFVDDFLFMCNENLVRVEAVAEKSKKKYT